MQYTAHGIQTIDYNKFVWHVIYEDMESLGCAPETNIILQVNYTSKKRKKLTLIYIYTVCFRACKIINQLSYRHLLSDSVLLYIFHPFNKYLVAP